MLFIIILNLPCYFEDLEYNDQHYIKQLKFISTTTLSASEIYSNIPINNYKFQYYN